MALCLAAAGLAALPGRPKHAAVPVGAYFNGVFPAEAPGASPGFASANAFPELTFTDPMWIAEIPGTSDMVVVEKSGRLKRFPKERQSGPREVSVALDLGSRVQISEDQGLYQIAFHPEFGRSGSSHSSEIFLSYNFRPTFAGAGPDASFWRLSRFHWDPADETIDPSSESVLIQQYDPNRWHNGGALAFDKQGFLLFTCGDGGGTDDQFGQSQALDGCFFGGVFRIDVDQDPERSHPIRRQPSDGADKPLGFPASFSQGYTIPHDNPWVHPAGHYLEETFAIGLRSPHTAHYDLQTDGLWVSDVGRTDREELNLVPKGSNLQWPFMEGEVPGPKSREQVHGRETPPVYAYDRSMGGCIIGGMRYRGSRWADQLDGKILFGDNLKGSLFTLDPDAFGDPEATEILSGLGAGIYSGLSNVCTDSAGDIYLLKLNGSNRDGGTVRILTPGKPLAGPPALLSDTGLFTDTARLEPSPALMSYEVASPLWSDGAIKRRWMALPNDGLRDSDEEQVAYSTAGNWSFPAGTVLVKHFDLALDEWDPSVLKRMETRVIICTAKGGKYGLTYRWNEQGTDAVLLNEGAIADYTITRENATKETFQWHFPSRADCMQCHSEASGQALGLRTHQINRLVLYPGSDKPVNQLAHFNSLGIFHRSLSPSELAGALAACGLDDESAPLEHRLRSYLDANCAHCHQPGGPVEYFDARLQTSLQSQGIIDVTLKGQYALPGGSYITPGHPELSAIYTRMTSCEPGLAMPPLGYNRIDARATSLLADYISGLSRDITPPPSAPLARYVCFTAPIGSDGFASIAEIRILDESGNPMPAADLAIAEVNSEDAVSPARFALDGDPATCWSSSEKAGFFLALTLDLQRPRRIGGFEYVPRQDSSLGRLPSYQVHHSLDGIGWTQLAEGRLSPGSGPAIATYRFDDLIHAPTCTIAASPVASGRDFDGTIVFDSEVRGFGPGDLRVSNGRVKALRGDGYYYVATISPERFPVSISVPAGVATASSHGNLESNLLKVSGSKNPAR
ncbi:PQQ-dependent sugar dehydrogenase [Luteolibacter sp. GHJ8]|uniref:PQQ-dependent sugar dehydrogenase n=1 Tax=Luteolibacter rhizosphaerae TaxID=2989719 RepID=A0ABT3G5K8_9BACT|nr:PQQ-dependent sugar dehydrogenase [Luteolibacter rhizosphaerae]MCW1915105.1 PQQ-dependent sugar dehydrogenase [Luteolibacter rhizosphaerae]